MHFQLKILTSLFTAYLFSFSAYSQEIKFEEPIRLSEDINSDYEEINPLLSSDGKSLYFARVFHPDNSGGKIAGPDIWKSDKITSGKWAPASNQFKQWNTKSSNAVIGINKNHTILYLLNSYTKKSGVAFSKLLNGQWTAPETIAIPGMERSEFVGYYMNPSFNILLISMENKDSHGQEDLYVSLKDSLEKWSAPINLGSTINTEGFEISPFLSDDGKTLYFSSNGHAGIGDADIFVSERLYKDWTVWTKPRNLGAPINSPKFDSYFSIYGDSVCLFSSNRNSDLSDIYTAAVSRINNNAPLVTQEKITYLTVSEIKKLTTKDLKEKLFFYRNALDLSETHKNQLNTLIEILNKQPDIHVRLVTKKAANADELDEYQKRLLTILKYLKTAGVDGSRVTFGTENDSVNVNEENGFILLRLYR